MSYKERLALMQVKAKEQLSDYKPGGAFSALPDDDYLMKVTVTLDETRKAPPRMTAVFCFVVSEGEYEGRQVWDRVIFEDNTVGLNILRSRVEALGYVWPEDDFPTLETITEDITLRAPSLTARLRSKDDGEYTNTRVYIREVHDIAETTPQAAKDDSTDTRVEDQVTDEIGETQTQLFDFCASQGIDGVTTDMSIEGIVNGIKEAEFTFKEEEISAEEKVLLEQVGLESVIIKKPASVQKKVVVPLKKHAMPVTKKTMSKKGKK